MPDSNGWISVEDEVPEVSALVLAIRLCRSQCHWWLGWVDERDQWGVIGNEGPQAITHWQPLPAPPGEDVAVEADTGPEKGCPEKAPEQCSECRFFKLSIIQHFPVYDHTASIRECRRKAPVVCKGFPSVDDDSWCGEFERRGEGETKP